MYTKHGVGLYYLLRFTSREQAFKFYTVLDVLSSKTSWETHVKWNLQL